MLTAPARQPKSWLVLALCNLLLVALAAGIGQPSVWHGKEWFIDGGLTLQTADLLLHGKKLFVDAFYQYGPGSIGIYVLWCKWFGNTVAHFGTLALLVALLNVSLVLLLLRRTGISVAASAVASIALLPYFLLPSPGVLYLHFEKTLTLAALLLWKPPAERSSSRGFLLGIALGSMQWMRFGALIGIMGGILVVDLMLERRISRALISAVLWCVAGVLMVEATLAAYLFATLPQDVATDVLWPYFMAASYSPYAAAGVRFPSYSNLHYFIGEQLPMVVCAVLGIVSLVFLVQRRLTERSAILVAPFVAFAIYCSFYYKHVWHYYQGTWLLVLPAALMLQHFPAVGKAVVALLCLPGLFVALRTNFGKAPDPTAQAAVLPTGDRVWESADDLRRNQAMIQSLAKIPDNGRPGVFFLSRDTMVLSSHLHFFYGIPQPARHSMIYPGWLQERDFHDLPNILDRSKAIVLMQDIDRGAPPQDACLWESHFYPHPYCDQISARLDAPVRVDNLYWIFPLRRP